MPILNEVNHRPESRMRENRQYGSEGGETGQPVFPTPITSHSPLWFVLEHLKPYR